MIELVGLGTSGGRHPHEISPCFGRNVNNEISTVSTDHEDHNYIPGFAGLSAKGVMYEDIRTFLVALK